MIVFHFIYSLFHSSPFTIVHLFAGGSVVETLSGFNRVVLEVVLSTIVYYHYSHCPKQTIKTLPPFLCICSNCCIFVYLLFCNSFQIILRLAFCSFESCNHFVFITYRILYIFGYRIKLVEYFVKFFFSSDN